jgi:hypothetical protein
MKNIDYGKQNSPGERRPYPRRVDIRADIEHTVPVLGSEIKHGAITPTAIEETTELQQTSED